MSEALRKMRELADREVDFGKDLIRCHTDGKHGWVRLDLDDVNGDVFMDPGCALALFYSLGLSIVGMGSVYDPGEEDRFLSEQQRAIARLLVASFGLTADSLEQEYELQRYGPCNVRQTLEDIAEEPK